MRETLGSLFEVNQLLSSCDLKLTQNRSAKVDMDAISIHSLGSQFLSVDDTDPISRCCETHTVSVPTVISEDNRKSHPAQSSIVNFGCAHIYLRTFLNENEKLKVPLLERDATSCSVCVCLKRSNSLHCDLLCDCYLGYMCYMHTPPLSHRHMQVQIDCRSPIPKARCTCKHEIVCLGKLGNVS